MFRKVAAPCLRDTPVASAELSISLLSEGIPYRNEPTPRSGVACGPPNDLAGIRDFY